MRILAITFNSELSGGANRSFLMVIDTLQKKYGNDIYTIIPSKGPIEDALSHLSLPYEIINIFQVGYTLGHKSKDVLGMIKTNIKVIQNFVMAVLAATRFRKGKYDIVYINGTGHFFGWYLAKRLKLPYVWHFRGYLTKEAYFVWNQRRKFNDPHGKIIVISKSMLTSLPQTHGVRYERIQLIHNGLQWTDEKIPSQDRTNGIHCLLCGRLVRAKGQAEAIEAIHILHTMGYTYVYLHLAGDTSRGSRDYLEGLKTEVRKYHLGEYVIFEGQVEHMSEFRRRMNIELMCSECEPFGRVTVEGMHSGLVVIGSNKGGTLDIIQDNVNGLLYEQGNADDLARKIKRVIEDEALAARLAASGREFTKTHFTVEQNVGAINQLLEEQARRAGR